MSFTAEGEALREWRKIINEKFYLLFWETMKFSELIWGRGVWIFKENSNFWSKIVSLFLGVEGLSEANQIAWRWRRRAWWVVKTNCHLNKILDCGIKIFTSSQKKIEITLYYMAVSHKDWELPNSRIWLAEINFDNGLDYSI